MSKEAHTHSTSNMMFSQYMSTFDKFKVGDVPIKQDNPITVDVLGKLML